MIEQNNEEKIDSFPFYRSWYEGLKFLENDAQKATEIMTILEYIFEEKVPENENLKKGGFLLQFAKPKIDADLRAIRAGKNGGRPKKTTEKTPKSDKKQKTKKGGLLKNKKGGFEKTETPLLKNKKPPFSKPTKEEFIEYVKTKTNKPDNKLDYFFNKFFDFYESKGWKVGKEPMKCWQAAVRTWLSRGAEQCFDMPKEQVVRGQQAENQIYRTYKPDFADSAPPPKEVKEKMKQLSESLNMDRVYL